MARKILLADDSVTAQNMGRKILADAGYDVVTVNNGSAALKRIAEIKPDLIVLDVYMPGYSGLEVCQRLKDAPETEHIPVLLTVGKLEPFKPEEARRVRADAHIIKPFEASELLTAITKLEDRMVPQQSDGSRFSTSVSGVERFGSDGGSKKSQGGESDTGWKSRLRFPSKKKKEEPEPEPEPEDTGATFRDFRKGKGKAAASAPFTVKAAPPAGQEPGLVPDIPRDITPEELDALSALAAKLDGPIPAAENIAPLAEKMGPAAEVPIAVPEAKSEEKKEDVAPAAVSARPEFPVEAPVAAVERAEPVEIPVEHSEMAAQPPAQTSTVGDAVAGEKPADVVQAPSVAAQDSESHQPETIVTVPVNAALLAEEPAPVDRADEPMFASTANAVAPAAEERMAEVSTAEVKTEEKPVEAVGESQTSEVSAATGTANLESKSEAAQSEASRSEGSKTADLKPEVPSPESMEQPSTIAANEAEPEEPSPSDEELAEALRLLTPSTGHADTTTIPTHGTLVAAGQLLAEEAARNASAGSRWVAQAVELSSEEAALSLEAEMLRAFATVPTSQPVVLRGTVEAGMNGVSAITAAVENRLASTDWAGGAKDLAEQGIGDHSASPVETLSAQANAVEMPVAVNTATPFAVAAGHSAVQSTVQPAAEPVAELKPVEAGKIDASRIAAEPKEIPAKVAETESAAEEAAPATFADAMSKNEVETPVEQSDSPVGVAELSAAEEKQNQDSSPEVGSEESMGKEVKGKKSNWHQIRTTPAGAAAGSDVVEAAKQAEHAAEHAPKAMAAAAAEGSPASSVPDAGTIASIVDSVMADLRPKIVEEIAKKLAGK